MPLITAPCFPSYPSAHGTLSGAAREVLERLYGPRHHDITFSTASVPNVILHYTTFETITDDIADARVYNLQLGIYKAKAPFVNCKSPIVN